MQLVLESKKNMQININIFLLLSIKHEHLMLMSFKIFALVEAGLDGLFNETPSALIKSVSFIRLNSSS